MKLRHKPQWQPQAIQWHLSNGNYTTVILDKCSKCGDIDTRTIAGYWELEDLGLDASVKTRPTNGKKGLPA